MQYEICDNTSQEITGHRDNVRVQDGRSFGAIWNKDIKNNTLQ